MLSPAPVQVHLRNAHRYSPYCLRTYQGFSFHIASRWRSPGLTTLGLVLPGCRTGRPDYSVNVPPNLLVIRPQKSVVFVQTPVRLAALSQAIDRAIPTGTSQHRLGAFPLAWQVSRQPATIRPGAQGLTGSSPRLWRASDWQRLFVVDRAVSAARW